MKASVHFELESPEDFVAFAKVFGAVAGTDAPASNVVQAGAPAEEKQIAAPATGGGTRAASKAEIAAAKKAKAEADAKAAAEAQAEADAQAAAEAEAAFDLDDTGDDPIVEEVTKAMVAKDLRAFIGKKGDTGPKEALAVLKQFGASKFDELKTEDYAKFLTALGKVA